MRKREIPTGIKIDRERGRNREGDDPYLQLTWWLDTHVNAVESWHFIIARR